MLIDKNYIIYVKDYQQDLLPRPQQKQTDLLEDKSETLKELGVVVVETGIWSASL